MEKPQAIELPVVYTSVEDEPMLFANQFVIQFNQDEFILTIGQVQPPMLVGSQEEKREQASKLTHVPIRVLIRVAMTRTRLDELAQLLTDSLRRYDETKKGSTA